MKLPTQDISKVTFKISCLNQSYLKYIYCGFLSAYLIVVSMDFAVQGPKNKSD